MEAQRIRALKEHYRKALLDERVGALPFWLRHSLDHVYGGYLTCLDREGNVYNTDKAMWLQGREVWLFAKMYNEIEPRGMWLDAARLGYEFLIRHGFDTDGRMFFAVTRDGRPLRKRRYLFTETFGIIACAEYARAAASKEALDLARKTYRLVIQLYRTPGALPPKIDPRTRSTKALAMPMILLATTQELRLVDSDPLYEKVVEQALYEIRHYFLHREEHALHEVVGPHGERLDSPEGRCVNPGHAIEVAWFMLREAEYREDTQLMADALDILKWSLDWGWDEEYGGLLYFVDIEGRPPEQLEWDMKLWWPHTEALYATLLAHHLTGEQVYFDWYEKLHVWAFEHFADAEYGEWFGYLHRDGSIALPVKGSMW